ncbi:hypothetical protein A33Q_1946 [Indibacter alkaliphilus LW1]|jgi:hypothetical protein|uniref:WbqC-like protein family protein n=1 Tax=Indibacter alkaliphilus (strain CCUG 57479 / KCTC 22604 / LW1) TaxID=1189612 RepID=S2E486_INDAL|nr:WbqC family protein [Indibacter alkaliphilus]EOZ97028.1 hypothetical protein A33Q_1946 [Indibacter alkaliphilus LW1]
MGIITELFHLPSIEYFTAIHGFDEVWLDDQERFQKQSFRNRTSILLANKTEKLSVPVYGGNKNRPYKDIRIDYEQKWLNVHLRGIQSAYGKAPFFEYYFPYLEKVYLKKLPFLIDMNRELLTVCLTLLRWKISVKLLSERDEKAEMRDLRGLIQSKVHFTERDIYSPKPYSQLFGVDFVPNLSIIDLLFCTGPEATAVIAASKKMNEQ